MRFIHPNIWTSATVDKLTDHQFRLYVSLISHADDDGYLELDPALLRALTFPRRAHPPRLKAFEEALDAIIQIEDSAGQPLICAYSYNDQLYGHHPKWDRYQKPSHPTPSRLPKCPKCAAGKGCIVNSVKDTGSLTEASSNPPPQVGLGRVGLGKKNKEKTSSPKKATVSGEKNPNVRKFLDYAFDAYKAKFNKKLAIVGGRDGKIIKSLLEEGREPFTLGELKALWDDFLESEIRTKEGIVTHSIPAFKGFLQTVIEGSGTIDKAALHKARIIRVAKERGKDETKADCFQRLVKAGLAKPEDFDPGANFGIMAALKEWGVSKK